MKKSVILFLISALILTGCNTKKDLYTNNIMTDKNKVLSDSNTKKLVANTMRTIETQEDLDNWNHPVKDVFKKNNVQIEKVDFLRNNKYPLFYVEFYYKLNYDSADYFEKIIDNVAKANAYWDFEIIDKENKLDFCIVCDRKKRKVTQIILNNKKDYFSDIKGRCTYYNRKLYKVNGQIPEAEALEIIKDLIKKGTIQLEDPSCVAQSFDNRDNIYHVVRIVYVDPQGSSYNPTTARYLVSVKTGEVFNEELVSGIMTKVN
jgi:hypothetical protein